MIKKKSKRSTEKKSKRSAGKRITQKQLEALARLLHIAGRNAEYGGKRMPSVVCDAKTGEVMSMEVEFREAATPLLPLVGWKWREEPKP